MTKNTPVAQQISTAAKINAIRDRALASLAERRGATAEPRTKCPTCVRPAASPYRFTAHDGKVGGCVDAFHTGHTCAGDSTRHHFSADAAKLRRDELAWLVAL